MMERPDLKQALGRLLGPACPEVGCDEGLASLRSLEQLLALVPAGAQAEADDAAREVAVRTFRRAHAEASDAARELRLVLALWAPVSRARISARRHDNNWAGRTPRDLSRDAPEQGRARPGRTDDDHRRLLCSRRGDEPVGRMADVDEPAGAAVQLSHAAGDTLEPCSDRADFRLVRTILDNADEDQPEPNPSPTRAQPEPKLAAQAA